jgi:hypothetical protein
MPFDALTLPHVDAPCMVGFKYRTSWGQVSLLIHPLGYSNVGVAFLMHLIDGIEQELLLDTIRWMQRGGGIIIDRQGQEKFPAFV